MSHSLPFNQGINGKMEILWTREVIAFLQKKVD